MANLSYLVAGAGGFIGGHVAASLLARGLPTRCVDIKPFAEWHQLHPEAENLQLDLRLRSACQRAVEGARQVFNLAADMGGMGFIENNKALCMLSVLINTHLLQASVEAGVERFFYSSSACVYNQEKQSRSEVIALRESDAYPAMPEDGYGWEKLFSERMCRHFREDFGLETRVARYHNVYGPHGTWEGGREKVPAALCRKVIRAKLTGEDEVEVWGDGTRTRSFTYIDDCLEGTFRLMASEVREPLNVGSSELVSVNGLLELIEEIAGYRVRRRYLPDAPLGVQGRNSDNTLIEERLGWQPSIRLAEGMEKTYRWIYDRFLAVFGPT